MNHKKVLTIIAPADFDHSSEDYKVISGIAEELNIEIDIIFSVGELYSCLGRPSYQPQTVGFDIDVFYRNTNIDPWAAINAIATIIQTTKVYNYSVTQPVKEHLCYADNDQIEFATEPRKAIIAAGVTVNTDTKLIKEFLTSHPLCVTLMPRGPGFTAEEKRQALIAMSQGQPYIPKLIQDKLKPKKKSKLDPFKLTPRQQQIFDLILERGISNKVIARTLNISESTVKLHMTTILKKCGVRNRTQLAVFSKKPVLPADPKLK